MGKFRQNWATFCFNIWSHWTLRQPTEGVNERDGKERRTKCKNERKEKFERCQTLNIAKGHEGSCAAAGAVDPDTFGVHTANLLLA